MERSYNYSTTVHTLIVNMDAWEGAFSAMMWDDAPTVANFGRAPDEYREFKNGKKSVHVFVYGGTLADGTIRLLLRSWLKGTWRRARQNASTARKTRL